MGDEHPMSELRMSNQLPKPEPCPVREYHNYMESRFNNKVNKVDKLPAKEEKELRTKVKDKLELENWTFGWIKKKDKKMKTGVRDEIRYISPGQKMYLSLNMASKAYLEAQKSGTNTPRNSGRNTQYKSVPKTPRQKRVREIINLGEKKKPKMPVESIQLKWVPKTPRQKRVRESINLGEKKKRIMHVKSTQYRLVPKTPRQKRVRESTNLGEENKGKVPVKRTRKGLKVWKTSQPTEDEIMHNNEILDYKHTNIKRDRSHYEMDYLCSVCMFGGTLMFCDHCPSGFHPECVGLEGIPEGTWFCSSCSCVVCGSSEYSQGDKLTGKTVLCCDQCRGKYHAECLLKDDMMTLRDTGLCSNECSKIFKHLHELVGISKPASVEGYQYTILRLSEPNKEGLQNFDMQTRSKLRAKLNGAKNLLHDCFQRLTEPRTKSDLVDDLLANRENELDRLNFWGFYTMVLEKGNKIMCVATFRVYDQKLAEMPFIGTRFRFRCRGMCRILFNELSKLLSEIGVERIILPAINEILDTWLTKFDFTKMTMSDLLELSRYRFITFLGTTMCQKVLTKSTTSEDTRV